MDAVCVTVPRLAEQMGTKPAKLRNLARREDDPLPVRYFDGQERYGFVVVGELEDWLARNTSLYADRRKRA